MNNYKEVKIKLNVQDEVLVVPVIIDFTGRKNLTNTKVWEDGEWHFFHKWEREDGQIDAYYDVLLEASKNGKNN